MHNQANGFPTKRFPTVCSRSRPFLSAMQRCPACGETVVAAQASEFVDSGEVRHHWTCDDCGHGFSTTIVIRD